MLTPFLWYLAVMSTRQYFIQQGDAVEFLTGFGANTVDLLITDPPYESLEKHRAVGTTTRLTHSKASSNDWFSIFPNSRFQSLFTQVFRVLKRDAHFYLFCDPETMFIAKPIAESVGFKFWKPLIWDKRRIGMGYHYRARYECILFFEKGKRRLNDLGIPDIIEAPRIHKGYPTEKPSAVSEVLIRQSSSEGDVVADPFAGSGSVGVASITLGRRFVGNDLSADAVTLTSQRIRECGGELMSAHPLVPHRDVPQASTATNTSHDNEHQLTLQMPKVSSTK